MNTRPVLNTMSSLAEYAARLRAELAAAPTWKQGSQWELDRQADLNATQRQLNRLQAVLIEDAAAQTLTTQKAPA